MQRNFYYWVLWQGASPPGQGQAIDLRLGCPRRALIPLRSTHLTSFCQGRKPLTPSSGATLPSLLVHNKPIAWSCEQLRSGLERQKPTVLYFACFLCMWESCLGRGWESRACFRPVDSAPEGPGRASRGVAGSRLSRNVNWLERTTGKHRCRTQEFWCDLWLWGFT